MENKILIKLVVPGLDSNFDIFIPVNELVWKIKKMIVKSIIDLTDIPLNINDNYALINKSDGTVYGDNELIINTNIRNSSELILISISNINNLT